MINKKDVTKIFKKVIKRDHGVPDRQLMHPKREWSVGLFLFSILIVAGSTYALIIFNDYSDISVDKESVEVNQLHYKRADAQEAIRLYQQRKDVFDKTVSETNSHVTEVEQVAASVFNPDVALASSTNATNTNEFQSPVSESIILE